MSTNHPESIDFQYVPEDVLKPLINVLQQGFTSNQIEVMEQLFVSMVLGPVGQLVPPDVIAQAVVRAMEQVGHVLGGCYLYIPKQAGLLRARRDREIIKNFTGNNHTEMARRYGVSEMRVRQILSLYNSKKPPGPVLVDVRPRTEWPAIGPAEGCHSPEPHSPGHAQQAHEQTSAEMCACQTPNPNP